jgi:hypothetical protein
MPDAPNPITAPPALPWQPYDASAEGSNNEDQTAPTTIYDSSGGDSSGGPWRKIQDGGAANPDGTARSGDWPGNGASDSGGWKQT